MSEEVGPVPKSVPLHQAWIVTLSALLDAEHQGAEVVGGTRPVKANDEDVAVQL